RRKRDVLDVGFDDLSRARDKNRLRDPWGYGLAEQRRWSSLGVMAFRPDWFRSPDLFAHLLRLRDGGFSRVIAMSSFRASRWGPMRPARFPRWRRAARSSPFRRNRRWTRSWRIGSGAIPAARAPTGPVPSPMARSGCAMPARPGSVTTPRLPRTRSEERRAGNDSIR